MDESCLGGLIMAPANAPIGNETADRGNIDDAPLAAFQHGSPEHFGADETMGEVEIHEALPRVEIRIFDGDIEIAPAHIVDEYVDGAGLVQHAAAKHFA